MFARGFHTGREEASVIDATLIDGDRASEELAAYFFLIADAVTGFVSKNLPRLCECKG